MIERDEELQKLLRRWESPLPRPELDGRVWNSVRQHVPAPRWKRPGIWLSLAAGILLTVGIARMGSPQRRESPPAAGQGISIATTLDATGFRPVSNGAITVVKAGRRQ